MSIGSPLYAIAPEHVAAIASLVALAGVALILSRHRFARLTPVDGLLVALLLASSAVHAGLALAHGTAAARVLFALDAIALAIVAQRVLEGRSAGRFGGAALAGSILAYWAAALGGEPPDQVGLATKLVEILALAIVLRPTSTVGRRAALGSIAITLLVFGTAASSWIGAFRAAASTPDAVAGHHVHAGGVAAPGTLMPPVAAREPTHDERIAAEGMVIATRAAIAKYADPKIAAADGYQVAGMHGIDFHASNPRYEKDGRIFDPQHPETLVYAIAPDGRPVLLGAMFQMPGLGQPGPTIGGPLTIWHAHQHICFSLTPPSLAGILSPLGTCPIGSFDMPLTAQMIHIWIVPGAPEPFGDLDDAWKRAYLQATVTRP
jgi:hypothetical protein